MPLETINRPEWTELVLDRPPSNVLDHTMLTDLVTALDELARAEAPLLLLRAVGKHFSTGYAIGDIPEEIFHRDPEVRARHPFEQAMHALTHYPSPIVAAVQGDAYGGAVELLACADMRVAARRVRLGVPPVRLGLVYSHSGLRRMMRSFGSTLVREMLLTGEAIGAERAYGAGFFNRLVPRDDVLPTAEEILRSIARGGPRALRGTRRILNLLDEAEVLPENVLTEIAELRHESWSGEEFVRAQEAFLQRRERESS